ncbi:MAG TPA: TIGR02587 family membrane protein [Candidatus Binatia bacterium]|nr:TIGR02587 family membrane protein [Candidatus Binatia bacterium]
MDNNVKYAEGLGRALLGASLFALPLFMTMEMWQFGFAMERTRLAALLLLVFPLLVGLSYFAGFERAFGVIDHVLDAFAAIAVAAFAGACILALIGVLAPDQPAEEWLGKIAVVTFPGAIGALLADKQMSAGGERDVDADRSYLGRIFLIAVGALFVALNVAPTDEMTLIAYRISPWQAALLAIVSVAVLHALLFWVDLPGRDRRRGANGFFSILLRYSFAGYGVCALASLLLLWAFGRTDGVGLGELVEFVVVLAFPAVLGAGLAHVVVGERRG